MTIRRREFLGMAGATGLFAAAGTPLSAAERSDASAVSREHRGQDAPVSAEWDMTWVDRVNGKQRAVFDSPAVSEGAAFFRANMWMNQYKEVYGTPRTELSAVVVIRHEGIAMAVNNEYWDRYELGKEFKLKTEEGKEIRQNPVAGAPAGTENRGTSNIPGFTAAGGIVLACNLAFRGIVSTLRKKDKLSGDEAEKAARSYLLPGVILQPSGIFAALRAQEAGCHYILGS